MTFSPRTAASSATSPPGSCCNKERGIPHLTQKTCQIWGTRIFENKQTLKLEVDEVAVAEKAKRYDGVKAYVVRQGTKRRPGPKPRCAGGMGYPPFHHEHAQNRQR